MGIRDWLAGRAIGTALFLDPNPGNNRGYQQKALRNAQWMMISQIAHVDLPKAYEAMQGGRLGDAHRSAYGILLRLPNLNDSIVTDVEQQAQNIFRQTLSGADFHKASTSSMDLYDTAQSLYQSADSESRFDRAVMKFVAVIDICQQAIHSDLLNGDAYILLALSYYQLAGIRPGERASDRILEEGAVPVMHRWNYYPVRTRTRRDGGKAYRILMDWFVSKYPLFADGSMLYQLMCGQYLGAMYPGQFASTLPELLRPYMRAYAASSR